MAYTPAGLRTVSVREARSSISTLLDAAENGETTLVIRYSKPTAVIAPIPEPGVPPVSDDEEIRWYRVPSGPHRLGFTAAANAAFLRKPREERARILETLAAIADKQIVVTTYERP